MKNVLNNYKIKSGVDTRFKLHHNLGVTFKPGVPSYNSMPIGTERMFSNYLKIKIYDEKNKKQNGSQSIRSFGRKKTGPFPRAM